MTIELKDLPLRWVELEKMLSGGTEVVLTRDGTTVGKVVPQHTAPHTTPRFDLHPGAFQPGPEFDDPLPEEFWTGEPS